VQGHCRGSRGDSSKWEWWERVSRSVQRSDLSSDLISPHHSAPEQPAQVRPVDDLGGVAPAAVPAAPDATRGQAGVCAKGQALCAHTAIGTTETLWMSQKGSSDEHVAGNPGGNGVLMGANGASTGSQRTSSGKNKATGEWQLGVDARKVLAAVCEPLARDVAWTCGQLFRDKGGGEAAEGLLRTVPEPNGAMFPAILTGARALCSSLIGAPQMAPNVCNAVRLLRGPLPSLWLLGLHAAARAVSCTHNPNQCTFLHAVHRNPSIILQSRNSCSCLCRSREAAVPRAAVPRM
jgi:hypothetical protein